MTSALCPPRFFMGFFPSWKAEAMQRGHVAIAKRLIAMSRSGGMTGISTEFYVLTNLRHEGRVLGHLGEHLISDS